MKGAHNLQKNFILTVLPMAKGVQPEKTNERSFFFTPQREKGRALKRKFSLTRLLP
jgi:hypothetical protein